jgi:hypothetical protein
VVSSISHFKLLSKYAMILAARKVGAPVMKHRVLDAAQ